MWGKRLRVAVWMLLAAALPARAAEPPLTVFAAASLADVLPRVGAAFTARTGVPVRYSFGATSALARQVESGARADAFVSADQEWMDYLDQRRLLEPSTRRDVVSNALVLVAPADSRVQVTLAPGVDLRPALGRSGRLVTGDPASVPVGRYARAALTRLGAWQAVEPRLVPADNVRTALNFIARGEAPLGIVYATDARVEARVRVVAEMPAGSHAPIVYPAALLAEAKPGAIALMKFLDGEHAGRIFADAGFTRP